MTKLRYSILAAALPIAGASALLAAPTPVPASGFDSIELTGGGRVSVRHGESHRVTLLHGDLRTSRVEVVRDGDGDPRLVIQACRSSCRDYRLEVEVVTPRLDAASIRGGGEIEIEGIFPDRESIALAVTGGGEIDARPLRAASVVAAVRGGGTIRAEPRESLVAAVSGGGSILYSGSPNVVQSVSGGGEVTRAR